MLINSITLSRKRVGNGATYGHLIVDTKFNGTFKFTTIENTAAQIQKGQYNLNYTYSPRFKYKTLQLMDVGKRTGIRIHPANRYNDVSGCIGVGLYNELDEIPSQIYNSRASVEILETIININDYSIKIIDNEEQDTIKIGRKSTATVDRISY